MAGSRAEALLLPKVDRPYIFRVLVTLAVSFAGGLAAEFAGLPAGWVAGSLLAVAVVSLGGFNTGFPQPLQAPVFLMVGIYAGTGVSPETLRVMHTWPGSFAILGVAMVLVVWASSRYLSVRRGWDRNAALLASLPGALSVVIALAEGLKTDMKRIAIAQILRVIVIVETVPLIALLIGHQDEAPATTGRPVAGFADLALLISAGIVASLLLKVMRLPGAWVMGGLAASASLFLSGIVEARFPTSLFILSTVALGAITGSRFRPGDLALLPRIAGPALAALGIASLISASAAAAVTLIFGISFIQALLAFAPGALDVLTILAYQMNIDPAYVAAHHVVRFVALTAAAPLLIRWLERKE